MDHSQKALLLKELAKTPAGARFRCGSASMEPTIAVGEQVRVVATQPADLRVGDVVVFESADGFILHRIVLLYRRGGWMLHEGDAASAHGPRRAMLESVIGRVPSLPRKMPRPRSIALALRNWAAGMRRRLPLG